MPKQIVDPKLEWEADHSGVIHLRKHPGESEFLEGYGTKNFGVKGYEPKKKRAGLLFGAGVLAAGILAWTGRNTLLNLALLLKESGRS